MNKIHIFALLPAAAATCAILAAAPEAARPDTPFAHMQAVPDKGGTVEKVLAHAAKSQSLTFEIAPDRKHLAYFLTKANPHEWQWGILTPGTAVPEVKYLGSEDNGFDICDFVWSPASDQVALCAGYGGVTSQTLLADATGYDQAAARTCAAMSDLPADKADEIAARPGRTELPAWGANGKYYENEFLAAKDGVSVFQIGYAVQRPDWSSVMIDGGKRFAALYDASMRKVRVFDGDRYVESFTVENFPVSGWWFTKDAQGDLHARLQAAVDVPGGDLATPPDWKWVSLDLGKCSIDYACNMDRGVLLRLSADDGSSLVFLDRQEVERIARGTK